VVILHYLVNSFSKKVLGSKWPVVSVRNGAASAPSEIKRNLDYLETFQNIVLSFDSDPAGQKAVKEIANLLEPGKCKIMHLSRKDANEYLMEGKTQSFVNDFWNARTFTPEGIICGPDLRDRLLSDQTVKSLAYPWDGLNAITYGMRKNELVLVTAGSGIGKSSVMRELVHYIISTTDEKVGCLFLEESVRQTGLGILSVEASKRFHITSEEERDWTVEDKEKALDSLNDLDQLVFWNHFGSSTLENLLTRVRYMVKGLDCQYIILDHISMVVYETTNERKAIDDIMVKLRTLVQELGIHLIVVSHLSRPQGTGHEEGSNVSLNQLRGSHSLAQLPDMIFALERNTQALDEQERNRTWIRVLKNRFSGESGPATLLQWDKKTGRLTEVPFDEQESIENGDDEFNDERDFG
jgi:twinkle protein